MLLSDAIDRYLADRANKGMAQGTVRNERTVLKHLLADIGNIQVSSLSAKHMDMFWSRHQDWAPGTFNRAKTNLHTFFTWCQARGIMPRYTDPLEGVRRRKKVERARLIIPSDEFSTLLDAAEDPRDRILVAIGLYMFTRISETTNLRWRDIDFQNHTASVFRFKTGTTDVLPICEELEHELKIWRLKYSEIMGEVVKPGWIVVPPYQWVQMVGVPGKKGMLIPHEAPPLLKPNRQMTTGTERVQRVLLKAGYDLDKGEGGHTLRRSGATALYNELSERGHDRAIRMCQAMLGHASIQTTEVYLALNLDRKARNDLLAGKRMFRGKQDDATVVPLEKAVDGQANTGAL